MCYEKILHFFIKFIMINYNPKKEEKYVIVFNNGEHYILTDAKFEMLDRFYYRRFPRFGYNSQYSLTFNKLNATNFKTLEPLLYINNNILKIIHLIIYEDSSYFATSRTIIHNSLLKTDNPTSNITISLDSKAKTELDSDELSLLKLLIKK